MIHVIAIVTAQPGQRAAVLAAMRANMAAVHAEDGCIEYTPAIDAPDMGAMQTPLGEDSFAVIEKWTTLDALKAHAASPHMKAYAAETRPLIASRAIHILTPA
jgi:quinol monooxygenase YgiN